MSIHCLAIGTNKTNRQHLQKAFQALEVSFHLSFAESAVDAIVSTDISLFSLIIFDSLQDDTLISGLNRYLEENHLDIPFLIVNGNQSPETTHKQITPANLAGRILAAMKEKFKQGKFSGINLVSTLQLIEMEKLTCTIGLSHQDYQDDGWLFFRDGQPIDAEFDGIEEKAAVEKLFSLDDFDIKVYNICPLTKDRLKVSCSKMIFANGIIDRDRKGNDGKSPGAQGKTKATGLAGLFMKVKSNR